MKLKRIGSIVMAIVIVLLLLVIAVTPIAAQFNNHTNHGNGNGNGAPPGQGNTYDGYAGQFLVIICGPPFYSGYKWVEEWQHGKTLAEPVSQVGTCYASPGTEYKIEIPAGTVVSGYYPGQGRVIHLEVKCVGGQLYFSPNLKLKTSLPFYSPYSGVVIRVSKRGASPSLLNSLPFPFEGEGDTGDRVDKHPSKQAFSFQAQVVFIADNDVV